MKKYKIFLLIFVMFFLSAVSFASEQKLIMTGNEALKILKEGNKRFCKGKPIHPNQAPEKRTELTKGQRPFAVILCCSDSRVPPEIIFDRGLGDIFVVRVAGNITDDIIIGSIEYAVEHLNVPLVIVLGHERCGAADVAVKGEKAPGKIQNIIEKIKPALLQARKEKGDLLTNTIFANIKQSVNIITKSKPILAEKIKAGKLKVAGAIYHLEKGYVELLK